MSNKPTWLLAERFRDVSAIEEAITNFAHDQTGNNATGIVLAVLEHQAANEAAKATGTAGAVNNDKYHRIGACIAKKTGDKIIVASAVSHVWAERLVKALNSSADPTEAARQPAPASEMLKVVRGEICYKSEADDQSYGMWCPVTPDYSPACPDGTEFCVALAATAAPVLSLYSLEDIAKGCKAVDVDPIECLTILTAIKGALTDDHKLTLAKHKAARQPALIANIETLTATIRSFGYTTYSQSREIAEALAARSQP